MEKGPLSGENTQTFFDIGMQDEFDDYFNDEKENMGVWPIDDIGNCLQRP